MEKSVAPPPAPAPEPAPVVAAAVPAPLSSVGPRFLPDDRASFTHTFRASGAEGLLIVGLYGDGKPGEVLLVPRQASAAARETLGAFADALNVALPYGVPLSPLARGLTALISAGEARSAIEHLCGYLESKFPE